MRGLCLVASISAVLGCTEGAGIAVDVRTDFDPGREFFGVRTEIWRGTDPRMGAPAPAAQDEVTAPSTTDFFTGRRVAEFEPVDTGDWWVRVSLLEADGTVLASRLARATVRGQLIVGLVISRSCEDVTCPGSGDPETDTECLGGQCVDPRCGVSGAALAECGTDECAADADCASVPHAACSTPVCVDGVCLLAADDTSCGSGMVCDVDDGCTGAPPDAGPTPDGGPGTDGAMSVDTGPLPMIDAGCMGECVPTQIDAMMQGCGRCGTQTRQRVCGSDCTWGAYTEWSACSGEGECSPSATEGSSQGCGNCGTEPLQRTCGGDCRWGGWSVVGGCGGQGPCSPGGMESTGMGCGMCGGSMPCSRTCDGSCNWGGWSCGGCTDGPSCVDAFGGNVCSGSGGIGPCGCPPGFGRSATCSGTSWTGCSGACLG